MFAILIFFFAHWFLSLFFHTFFLHRYASHQMYHTSKGWEKTFYLMTWITQGSSFLVPRAYGVMHRMHHEYSDTEQDPHSPHFFKDIWQMMWHTAQIYKAFLENKRLPEEKFTREYLPIWNTVDRIGNSWVSRLLFILAYISFYIFFAPSFWWFLLLPIHFLMGPIQGAIVNWFGHKLGYQNYNNGDHSRNSTPWGFFMMGELFQNNHHHAKNSANFAKKWFEFDVTYIIMRLLHTTRIIRLKPIVAE